MRRAVFHPAIIFILAATGAPFAQAQDAQPDATPASPPAAAASSAPTTRPAKTQDPLHLPRSMMSEFLLAVEASEKKPERLKDAVRCLDLSERTKADPAEAAKQGPVLARQLEQVIDALLNTYGRSRDEIPQAPSDPIVTWPAEGEVQLVLTRSADGLWRFSPETVAAIPALLETARAEQKRIEAETPKPVVHEGVPRGFRSARATMRTFLEAMIKGDTSTAARCLDLSERPIATRKETGADLAERLKYVMDRIAFVVYQDIPDRPDGEPYAWHIGEDGRIELARQEAGEDEKTKGYWLFSRATCNSIEPLFKAYQDRPRVGLVEGPTFWKSPRIWLNERISPSLRGEALGVQLWQWIGIAIMLLVGYGVHRLALLVFSAVARPLGRSSHVELMPSFIASSLRPLAMLVMLATWWGGLRLIGIPVEIMEYVWPALKLVMTLTAVWACYRLIDLGADFFAARAAQTVSRLDDVLVPLVRKTAKIIVVIIGLIYTLKAVGISENSVNKMFAGLGLGGLAFALAAKDTVANFFGSVTVVLDRPFQVGDWVKIGQDVEGTVESVGLRSSRIRTFYNSQVTVPNAELVNATVDNMGRRQYRRISCKLSVTYSTTPEQLEAFCEGVRELVRRHPYTRKDYYLVWVNEFADSAVNILLYCFHEVPDWVTEMRERHRLFLDIMRLAKRLGVEFAFPTHTLHLARDSGRQPAAVPGKAPAATPSAPADEEHAVTWGRETAAKVAEDSGCDPDNLPPPFEFPAV